MAAAKTAASEEDTTTGECECGGCSCGATYTAGSSQTYYQRMEGQRRRETAMDFAIRLVESVNSGATEMTQRWVPDDPSELAGKVLAFLEGE